MAEKIAKEPAHLHIRLSGTPAERGFAYGAAAKDRVKRVLDEYRILFRDRSSIEWDAAKKLASRYESPIRAYRPDLIEEMRGIAEGAGVGYEDILAANCRTEILYAKALDACTVIGVPPEASSSGKTFLAQNWDWSSMGRGTTVVLEVTQAGGPRCLIATEAGLVGGKGINEAGVGLSLNALSVRKSRIGVPLHILMRNALQQATLPKAIDALASARRAGGACVGLASADGLVALCEAAPRGFDILTSGGRPLCHTNHWLSPLLAAGPEAVNYTYTSSWTRLDRARRLLAKEEGAIRRKTLFRVLSDHAGHPDGICRHDDETLPAEKRQATIWSMVLDLEERTLWLTDGHPCVSPARAYRFS